MSCRRSYLHPADAGRGVAGMTDLLNDMRDSRVAAVRAGRPDFARYTVSVPLLPDSHLLYDLTDYVLIALTGCFDAIIS